VTCGYRKVINAEVRVCICSLICCLPLRLPLSDRLASISPERLASSSSSLGQDLHITSAIDQPATVLNLRHFARSHIALSISTATMASRTFSPAMRAIASPSTALRSCSTAVMGSRLLSPAARSFQTSSRRFAEVAVPLPVRKPVGAFRGG